MTTQTNVTVDMTQTPDAGVCSAKSREELNHMILAVIQTLSDEDLLKILAQLVPNPGTGFPEQEIKGIAG